MLIGYLPAFLFVILLMTAFTSFSHGTQDLYPTFLLDRGIGDAHVGLIAAIANIGALIGGVCCGTALREASAAGAPSSSPRCSPSPWCRSGPGRTPWSRSPLGGFLMQFMVQGAWGIIPAHLNELSPAPVRAIFPGLAYQLGNLLSSRNAVFQESFAIRHNAGSLNVALSGTVVIVAIVVASVTALGPEAKGADLS